MGYRFPGQRIGKGQLRSSLGYFYPEEAVSDLSLTSILKSWSTIPSIHTMSKAFSKSRKTARVICFLDGKATMSCINPSLFQNQLDIGLSCSFVVETT